MRFAALSAAVLGFVASALAQDGSFDPIYTPARFQEVPVGQPFTITWDPQPAESVNAPISIALIGGREQALQVPLYTIVSGISNSLGRYTWTPAEGEFGKNFYGLVITNLNKPAQFQYSNPFKVVANPALPSTTTTKAQTTTTNAVSTVSAATTEIATTDATTTLTLTTATSSMVSVSAQETKPAATTPCETSVEAAATSPCETSVEAAATTPCETAAPAPTFAAPHVPHYGGNGGNNNGTVTYHTQPISTFATAVPTQPDNVPVHSVSAIPTAIPTGGAVAKGVSFVLVGASALFALTF